MKRRFQDRRSDDNEKRNCGKNCKRFFESDES